MKRFLVVIPEFYETRIEVLAEDVDEAIDIAKIRYEMGSLSEEDEGDDIGYMSDSEYVDCAGPTAWDVKEIK